jgi:hypothetical protein
MKVEGMLGALRGCFRYWENAREYREGAWGEHWVDYVSF